MPEEEHALAPEVARSYCLEDAGVRSSRKGSYHRSVGHLVTSAAARPRASISKVRPGIKEVLELESQPILVCYEFLDISADYERRALGIRKAQGRVYDSFMVHLADEAMGFFGGLGRDTVVQEIGRLRTG